MHLFATGLLLLCVCFLPTSCAYEAVQLPVSKEDVTYHLVTIDAALIEQMRAARAEPVAVLHPQQRAAGRAAETAKSPYDYVIGAGDVLQVNLYVASTNGEKGLTRIIPQAPALESENKFLVAADGTVNIPYAGQLRVEGKSFALVRQQISKAVTRYFVNPKLEVSISRFSNSRFVVSGEVTKPQEVQMSHERTSVLGAIALAGGVLPSADLTQASLLRADGAVEAIDLQALLHDGDAQYNQTIYPGDRLHIPRNHANRLFVTGEVLNPRSVTMPGDGMSLTEVLGEAGGLNPMTARPSKIYVLRAQPYAAKGQADVMVYRLDASNPQAYVYGDQFRMAPRDVVYVGTQWVTDWNRFIAQFLPGSVPALVRPADYYEQ